MRAALPEGKIFCTGKAMALWQRERERGRGEIAVSVNCEETVQVSRSEKTRAIEKVSISPPPQGTLPAVPHCLCKAFPLWLAAALLSARMEERERDAVACGGVWTCAMAGLLVQGADARM